ncbi:MAG: TonB-dependent receptor [Sphingomonadaceae bacterium]|nr:TonB-dependent receptor [Sphingomonadaceae bacterium]
MERNFNTLYIHLISSVAFTGVALAATPALAQDAEDDTGLGVIIVTAQKREQSLQNVPIAVTAITGDRLEANRVVNVNDLSALAPGVTVRPSAGGSSIATFTTRGAVSFGVVPGSDKQISIYLDGVYISSPRGSIFELPDIERIEILRGPQGTLFGRNATAGAVSINTREPSGEAKVKASTSVGNLGHHRFRLTMETPQIGPFSAYGSFSHNKLRGDIRNLGPFRTYDRSLALRNPRSERTSEWLGGHNTDSYFGALKFDPGGDFTAMYKFDRSDSSQSPTAVGVNNYNPNDFLFGPLYDALFSSQDFAFPLSPNNRHIDAVSNGFATIQKQKNSGHNLTMDWAVSDSISIKNVAAYRTSEVYASGSLAGISGVTFTEEALDPYARFVGFARGFITPTTSPEAAAATISAIGQGLRSAGWIGAPFVLLGAQPQSRSKSWSNELQINYDSDFLTLTLGGLYFKGNDYTSEDGFQNTAQFVAWPGGVSPYSTGIGFNQAHSYAAFTQGELHLRPKLDLILGGRITHDKKSGKFSYGTLPDLETTSFGYSDTRFNYLVGVNYKPNDDTLIYGKWSTAFVSGGSVGPVAFKPETAKSAEAGVKVDLLDRRLRVNLALYWAQYKDYQSPQAASTLGPIVDELTGDSALSDVFGIFVYRQGDIEAKGLEFEVAAAPTSGLTVGSSLSYSDVSFKNVPSFLKAAVSLSRDAPDSEYRPPYRPKWTGSLYAQYETEPLFGDAYAFLRLDGNYQSRMQTYPNNNLGIPELHSTTFIPSYWLVNGRAAIKDISIGGVNAELALWGKNLLDENKSIYNLLSVGVGASMYLQPRTYGMDFTIDF